MVARGQVQDEGVSGEGVEIIPVGVIGSLRCLPWCGE